MGIKKAAPRVVVVRPQKDVAHLGYTRRVGALKHGIPVCVKFLPVQMGVAVYPYGRQRKGQGINADS